ncbi:hypothetical protein BDQ12DRAFT_667084 [Crucibulum laeve]|uniref:Uncharacterized protein n=1 Tax=Crucibulum laeve TaxID=68775 RepID=A0A5C3LXA5_9AGAR|nr:hypothetical protein BDQ12DRAFT_667084 [Crucibulum laeve]
MHNNVVTPQLVLEATMRHDTSSAMENDLQVSSTALRGFIRSEHEAETFEGGKNLKINGKKPDIISNTAGISIDCDDDMDLDKVVILYKIVADAQTQNVATHPLVSEASIRAANRPVDGNGPSNDGSKRLLSVPKPSRVWILKGSNGYGTVSGRPFNGSDGFTFETVLSVEDVNQSPENSLFTESGGMR